MGEFSLSHLLFLLIIVLVFFGPKKLPGLGKALGETIRGFKKEISGLHDEDASSAQASRPATPVQQVVSQDFQKSQQTAQQANMASSNSSTHSSSTGLEKKR